MDVRQLLRLLILNVSIMCKGIYNIDFFTVDICCFLILSKTFSYIFVLKMLNIGVKNKKMQGSERKIKMQRAAQTTEKCEM